MDVVLAVSGYISKMASAGDTTGGPSGKMKALLLDGDTVSIVSTAITQSALLSHEVYLIEYVWLYNQAREKMRHLRCLCFVRPTPESVQLLIDELREPKYGEYYLYFSNIIRKSSLERLAEADDHEVVRSVQEYFADYIVINPDLFTLNLQLPQWKIWSHTPETWNAPALQRTTDGLIAVLLSLKKKPLIRYEKNSVMAKKLATEIRYQMTQEEQLFDFRRPDTPPILLIVDRRGDPVTPLLSQWTYQAMVHEMLGIRNGRVDLSHVAGVRPEVKEITLSQDQDAFFQKNMYANWGDIGINVKEYVEQYATKKKGHGEIESMEDMKRFVEEYADYSKLSGTVSKHITLLDEMVRRVAEDDLLAVSELEQSLACENNHYNDLKNIQRLLPSAKIPAENKLRLIALYALRYERHPANALPLLLDLFSATAPSSSSTASAHDTINRLLAYHHSLQAGPLHPDPATHPATTNGNSTNLFGEHSSSLISTARERFSRISLLKGLQGVDNVFTQHSPRLRSTLQALIRGRLREQEYPFLSAGPASTPGAAAAVGVAARDKPQEIIVFVVGGVTYEEANAVAQLNATSAGVRLVLGGTAVCNSASFLEDMQAAVAGWPAHVLDLGPKKRLLRELGR
ncbi:MAG: vacuolar protein sorting-associated protein 45 [Phylliscum demangeonii]|nr:MAG: vacuolar protein sorting-associated protein 45 [Phylliscum demangeonii]